MAERGRHIVLEGGEHLGKSTHARRLAAKIGGISVHEPGGTPAGAELRRMLLDPSTELTLRSEVLLMAADRAILAETIVEPALSKGIHVVKDRSWMSSAAYQGESGENFRDIRTVNKYALGECITPDLGILLDGDPLDVIDRIENSGDRYERLGLDFHRNLRHRYLMLADRERFIVVNAARALEEVCEDINEIVRTKLKIEV